MLQGDGEVRRVLGEAGNGEEEGEGPFELLRVEEDGEEEERALPIAVEVVLTVRLVQGGLQRMKRV